MACKKSSHQQNAAVEPVAVDAKPVHNWTLLGDLDFQIVSLMRQRSEAANARAQTPPVPVYHRTFRYLRNVRVLMSSKDTAAYGRTDTISLISSEVVGRATVCLHMEPGAELVAGVEDSKRNLHLLVSYTWPDGGVQMFYTWIDFATTVIMRVESDAVIATGTLNPHTQRALASCDDESLATFQAQIDAYQHTATSRSYVELNAARLRAKDEKVQHVPFPYDLYTNG